MAPNAASIPSQPCAGSVLTIARAAQALSVEGGGLLELTARDASFPLDVRDWCSRSGSELVELISDSGRHHAKVRVPARAPTAAYCSPGESAANDTSDDSEPSGSVRAILDCRGLHYPLPLDKLTQRARLLPTGAELDVLSDDPHFRRELSAWCRTHGADVSSFQSRDDGVMRFRVRLAETTRRRARASDPSEDARPDPAKPGPTRRETAIAPAADCRIVVSSPEPSALASALGAATDAAADGAQVSVLFTLRGLEALRAQRCPPSPRRSWAQRVRQWLSPTPPRLALDRPDGTSRRIGRLFSTAERGGVRLVACLESMAMMGLTRQDFGPHSNLDYDELAPFLETASGASQARVF